MPKFPFGKGGAPAAASLHLDPRDLTGVEGLDDADARGHHRPLVAEGQSIDGVGCFASPDEYFTQVFCFIEQGVGGSMSPEQIAEKAKETRLKVYFPTGMKTGVSTTPLAKLSCARRARPSVLFRVNSIIRAPPYDWR